MNIDSWHWLKIWITNVDDSITERFIYANIDECIEAKVLEEFGLEWGKNIKDFKWSLKS